MLTPNKLGPIQRQLFSVNQATIRAVDYKICDNLFCIFIENKANLKNIFVSPYPTRFYQFGSVGQNFFLTSQIGYPLNLIVYSKTCLQRPLKQIKKFECVFFQDRLSHNAGQKYCRMLPGSILQYFRPSFNL